jgi:hypothetical protein
MRFEMNPNDLFEPIRRRRSRLERLVELTNNLDRNRQELQRAIADYRAFQPGAERSLIEGLEKTAANLSMKIADQEVNAANLDRRLRDANSARVGPLVVWKFFTAEQKQIRASASLLAEAVSAARLRLSSDQAELSKIRAHIISSEKRILSHGRFDLDASAKRLSSIGPEVDRLRAAHASDAAELVRIETKIRPHAQELDRMQTQLAALSADVARANVFEKELSAASNTYERKRVHEQCEAKFGTGSPKQVINDRRHKIRSLENNIPKVERRVQEEFQKLERTIGRLVIDGNNACYEGQTFIGPRAISALIRELGGRYKTTVVFDASIRALLKTDSQGVERILGTSGITHIAPTKTAADEYLMKLADQDRNTFILSNDRFAEYHDYEVIKSGRVLRFLIAGGKIMANDIDISASI